MGTRALFFFLLPFFQLLGFGSALLDNVDPNPENFVGAGIIQTKALQVGCLLRLEPNAQAQVSAAAEVLREGPWTCLSSVLVHSSSLCPSLPCLCPSCLSWPLVSFILYFVNCTSPFCSVGFLSLNPTGDPPPPVAALSRVLPTPSQMYRLTLRTSKEPVSRHLCELLAQQF